VKKWVYFFGAGKAEGDGTWRDLLGGKGAGLAEMTRIGLPVPAGFTISTEACDYFYKNGKKYPAELKKQVAEQVARLEKVTRKKLGDPKNPLLVSVRSGSARSMPGMMETILNLGLNERSVQGLAQSTKNERFAYDAYRRFVQMYSTVVMELPKEDLEHRLRSMKERLGVKQDTDVPASGWKELLKEYKANFREKTGKDFPEDPIEQLWGAIGAVFGSWMAEKAVTYRRVEKITGLLGTAVNVMQMVFGNTGDTSGTGVCFTRDPSSGEKIFYGDYLVNAQGEDVVAGRIDRGIEAAEDVVGRPDPGPAERVLAAVAGAIGGAAVTGLFAPGTDVFAWYSIGLLAGMALFFVIFGRLNGLQRLATVLSVRTEVLSGSNSGTRGANRPQASPDTEEVS